MRHHRRRHWAIALTAFAFTLVSCSDNDKSGDTTPSRKDKSESPSRKSFDPPTRFARATAVRLPYEARGSRYNNGTLQVPLPVVLYGTKAFIATELNVLVVDTATGKSTTVAPELKPTNSKDVYKNSGNNSAGAPQVATVGGKPTVIVAIPVTLPGKGTKPARPAAEIIGVEAQSGKHLWSIPVALSNEPDDALVVPVQIAVVGVSNNVAVLRAGHSTYAIDLATKKVLWSQKDFAAVTVTGAVTVGAAGPATAGLFEQRAAAYSVSDGKQLWIDDQNGENLQVEPAGPNFVLVAGDSPSGGTFFRSIEVKNAKVHEDVAATGYYFSYSYRLACHYDDVSVAVCAIHDDVVAGFDAVTGKRLWELPDKEAGRTSVNITGAWHGVAYGVTGNGPVMLNARTGADAQQTIGIAPYVVNGYAGIAGNPKDGDKLYAFVATG